MTFDLDSFSGPTAVAQLLDEHHLVLTGADDARRGELVRALTAHLEAIADAEIIRIDGDGVSDLASFAAALDRGLRTGGPPARSVADVVTALRAAPRNPRYQFFIWERIEPLLDADPKLFGRLVNAFFGVAAEREQITPGSLVLQRVVLVGGAGLHAFAQDAEGPCRRWLIEDEVISFWEVASCVARPPVITFEV